MSFLDALIETLLDSIFTGIRNAALTNEIDNRKRINVRKLIKEDIAKIGGEQVVIQRQRLWGRKNPAFLWVTYTDAQQRAYKVYVYVSFNSFGLPCRLEWRVPPEIDAISPD